MVTHLDIQNYFQFNPAGYQESMKGIYHDHIFITIIVINIELCASWNKKLINFEQIMIIYGGGYTNTPVAYDNQIQQAYLYKHDKG